jgi:hypothetical protein
MKKIGLFILSFILCFGPFSIAMAQKSPTICAVHPFTGRFAFAGIEGSAAMQDVVDMVNEAGGINGKKNPIGETVSIRTMLASLPLNGSMLSIIRRLCSDRAQG